jgi:mRNA-degrading endonuclease RelE of RelBE toxin-antitoxin system
MEFDSLSEFRKDFEKLLKKYPSLIEDFNILKQFLCKHPRGFPPIIFQISDLGIKIEIFKVKKFRCKSLKGSGSNSGIRIIYALLEKEQKIEFIEIYFKGKKSNHDKERILKYYE